MNIIKFNNTEFQVESYNRTTSFSGENISCMGGCTLVTENIGDVSALADTTITSIQIYVNEELIYNLQDINAHVDNINEYFNGERVSVSVNLIFDMTSNS